MYGCCYKVVYNSNNNNKISLPSTDSRLFFNEEREIPTTYRKGCHCYILLLKEQFPLPTMKEKENYLITKSRLHIVILLTWPNHWQWYQVLHWMRYVLAPVITGFICVYYLESVLHQVKLLSYEINFGVTLCFHPKYQEVWLPRYKQLQQNMYYLSVILNCEIHNQI